MGLMLYPRYTLVWPYKEPLVDPGLHSLQASLGPGASKQTVATVGRLAWAGPNGHPCCRIV